MSNSIYKPVLMFYAKTTSWIVAPIGIAILVSRLTEKEHLLLPLVILGFLITIFGIYREIKIYKKTLTSPSPKATEEQVPNDK